MTPNTRTLTCRAAALCALSLAVACNGNGVEPPATRLPDGLDGSVPFDAAAQPPDCVRPITGFLDRDGDGHGDAETLKQFCDALPEGWVSIDNDCDDRCAECSPIGTEVCDGLDNDCDLLIDDGLGSERFYADADGDGFGLLETRVDACMAPPGHVALAGDCRDDDDAVNPGAPELCNAIDDDCNGLADEPLFALTGEEVFLGDANAAFREIALGAWQGGWLAAWTGADRRIVFLHIGADASVDPAAARPLAPAIDLLAGQETPSIGVVRGARSTWGVISWVEGGVVRARSVRLPDGALGATATVSTGGDLARLPLVVETTQEDVAIVWLVNGDRQETHARLFDPATGALGAEATVFVSDRTSPDNYGPSAVVLPSAPSLLLLGVVNQVYPDEVPVGYVRRVQLRPQLAAIETGAARLEPSGGGAAERVVLSQQMDRDDASLLAFVTSGSPPTQVTDVFDVTAREEGAVTASDVMTVDGLVLDAIRAPSGADLVTRTFDSTERVLLSLTRVSPAGELVSAGPLDTLMPPTWASLASRSGIQAAAMWSGRISASDIDPGVWFRRYGCGP